MGSRLIRAPAVALDWDMSICLQCYLYRAQILARRPTSRRRGSALRGNSSLKGCNGPPSRSSSTSDTLQSTLPTQRQRGFHRFAKSSQESSVSRRIGPPSSLPFDWSRPRSATQGSAAALPNTEDVRGKLRHWWAQEKDKEHWQPQLIPEGLRLPGEVLQDDPTRSEQLDALEQAEDEDLSPETEEVLLAFDRITDMSQDAYASSVRLRKGDLVELDFHHASGALLAVFVGLSEGDFYQFLTASGGFIFTRSISILFRAEGFIESSKLDAVSSYLPPSSARSRKEHYGRAKIVPQAIVFPLLRGLTDFWAAVEDFYRKNSARIDTAHARLAHPTEIRFIRLEDLVADIVGQKEEFVGGYPPHVLYSVTNALVTQNFGFFYACPQTFAQDQMIVIYSKEDVGAMFRVQEWTRAYQEKIALEAGSFGVPKVLMYTADTVERFARKARKIIKRSRSQQLEAPDGAVLRNKGTTEDDSWSTDANDEIGTFTPQDLDIIRVLKLHGGARALAPHRMLQSVPTMILRAVGTYDDDVLTSDIAFKFLVELGITDPFAVRLPFDHYVWGPSQELDEQLVQAEAQISQGETVEKALKLKDSMEHLRKDWEDMRVFCIDSEGTREVDDGISLEEIPGTPDQHWIHVHIAHMSSLIGHDSLLGKVAAHRISTQYHTSERLPMLPPWVSKLSSLAAGQPVLTFSIKVNEGGEVIETQIQPGVIRNVLQLPPEVLDSQVFGEGLKMDTVYSAVVGQAAPQLPRTPRAYDLSDTDTALLRKLHDITSKVYAKRPLHSFDKHSRMVEDRYTSVTANVSQGSSYLSIDQQSLRNTVLNEDPTITFESHASTRIGQGAVLASRMIVEQCMLLAGTAAGKWAYERGVPVPYTGSRPAVEGLEELAARLRRTIAADSNQESLLRNLVRFYAGAQMSSAPIEQKFMGSSFWSKVTSPLRRYSDLLCHWQIDAALREEARSGKSLLGNADESFLPYKKADVDAFIDVCSARTKKQALYGTFERKHWKLQFLGRAHFFGEAELPKPLICEVRYSDDTVRGYLPQLQLLCIVRQGDTDIDPTQIKSGEAWEVEIESIVYSRLFLFVKPVKKVQKEAPQLEA